jgi:uncharacterized protein (TIGR03435 family)
MIVRLVGLLLLATGPTAAQAQTAPERAYPRQFEVASVRLVEKPSGDGYTKISDPGALLFTAHNASLVLLMQMAFGVNDYQIEGDPAWMSSTLYDVSAKPDTEKGPTYEQLKPMLQQLLVQRFHLQTHTDQKEVKGYSLVVAKSGERLTPSKNAGPTGAYITQNRVQAHGVELKALASVLSFVLRQPVDDETGIKGAFDVSLEFAPIAADVPDSSLPSIFTAVEEQLGLKLEPAKVPVQMVVIDHVDRAPTEN